MYLWDTATLRGFFQFFLSEINISCPIPIVFPLGKKKIICHFISVIFGILHILSFFLHSLDHSQKLISMQIQRTGRRVLSRGTWALPGNSRNNMPFITNVNALLGITQDRQALHKLLQWNVASPIIISVKYERNNYTMKMKTFNSKFTPVPCPVIRLDPINELNMIKTVLLRACALWHLYSQCLVGPSQKKLIWNYYFEMFV